MTGLVRKASIFTACGLLAAAAAMAGVPSPANSTKPSFVVLTGYNPVNAPSDHGDPNGTFTVIVRDAANNPIANSQVVVDLGACSDSKLCPLANTGQTADCPTKTVRGFTDGTGSITFNLIGAAVNNVGGVAGPGGGCANITADGVSLFHPTVNVFDENGAITTAGMEVSDLAAFLKDLGTGFYFGRSDFSGPTNVDMGVLSVVDLSVFLSRLGTGQSANGCTVALCP